MADRESAASFPTGYGSTRSEAAGSGIAESLDLLSKILELVLRGSTS
jgi:hypothetical protein